MLTLTNLSFHIADRPLIRNVSVQIADGQCVGLVGQNGAGKTTLFKLILGALTPDGGEVSIGRRQSIGTVAQEVPSGDQTLVEIVLEADKERTRLLAEAESTTDPARIAEIHTRLADMGAHAAPARAATILAGLGFDEITQQRSIKEFSGGWKMRVALAAALFSEPDILLLDEPSNHLDLEAALWLESYLTGYPKTLIIISHDRGLLNRIPDRILHLHEGALTLYGGNYDTFENTRRKAIALQASLASKQEEQRAHMQKFVDRFRYKASKARQAQSRIKFLEKMEPIMAMAEEHAVTFNLPNPEQLAPPILTMDNVCIGYDPEKPVLTQLNLRIDMDDRIALLGANGNGKTTLLRFLAGRLQADAGELRKSGKLTVGYFAQNQLDELNASITPIEQIRNLCPGWLQKQIRSHLSGFGIPQSKAETSIQNLSGGEKARLALSCICLNKPHILLLDEPTNHLDMDSRQALIQALTRYEGAVILVSHDPYLVNACADRLWLVAEGNCKRFDGTLDDYKSLLLRQRREERRNQRHRKEVPAAPGKKPGRKNRAQARAASANLRKAAKDTEKRIAKLTAELEQIYADMANPAIHNSPVDRITSLKKKAAELKTSLKAFETTAP